MRSHAERGNKVHLLRAPDPHTQRARTTLQHRQRRQRGMLAMSGRQIADEVADRFEIGPRRRLVEGRAHLALIGRLRNSVQIGTSPRNGTSSSAARRFAPPEPKISCRALQLGQRKKLMFSTMPSTSMLTLRNMAIALTASNRATSCGVQTTTAPVKRQQLRKR